MDIKLFFLLILSVMALVAAEAVTVNMFSAPQKSDGELCKSAGGIPVYRSDAYTLDKNGVAHHLCLHPQAVIEP